MPSTEALFWFLLCGEIPSQSQMEDFRAHLLTRTYIPHHIFTAIDNLPKKSDPVSRFCVALLCWTTTSTFMEKYDAGIPKEQYWEYSYADALTLIAGLNQITSYIYTRYCKHSDTIAPDYTLDWAGNLSRMMGFKDAKAMDFIRLFIFTHADHGPANASAHTCHLVGSTLVNAFYTCVASMVALAGPLHGHANEETFKWLLRLQAKAREEKKELNHDFISDYIENELQQGRKIPGYGHAALRVEDPRYTLVKNFIHDNNIVSEYVHVADMVYDVAPGILSNVRKISNPNPNIDAITGAALYSLGITEFDFYTVLFGTGRIIGLMAQHIIDRILQIPIERPKAFDLEKHTKKNTKSSDTT
ncbi:citrate synthase, mitochondrial-like [Ylistrum balloti]|uniref:citrate synthase, mitochondrial-like n=1 Tax=Ylistrum balloti TaxID=509963 RepID=UPI002905E6B0|nr:citrate synthase, mitochondrial-like [Ylistrum balloti]